MTLWFVDDDEVTKAQFGAQHYLRQQLYGTAFVQTSMHVPEFPGCIVIRLLDNGRVMLA